MTPVPTAEKLAHRARKILAPMLDERGVILMSSAETLRKGDIYVLGVNPGTGKDPDLTIGDQLDRFPSRTSAFDKSYWSKESFPERLKRLVDSLHEGLWPVCVSNLIFTHSRTAGTSGHPEQADACWPVHELSLDIVRPRMIVPLGSSLGRSRPSALSYLREKFKGSARLEYPSGHGMKCKACAILVAGRRTMVVGAPHPSRFAVKHEAVGRWMRSLL